MAVPHTNDSILRATVAKGKEMIKENLQASDKWVCKAILAIYARQTADEQASDTTSHHNGRGFTGADAEILSSFARQIQEYEKGNSGYRSPLSARQLEIARKRIGKYAGQLLLVAQAREQAEYLAARQESQYQETKEPEFDEWKAEMAACGIDA